MSRLLIGLSQLSTAPVPRGRARHAAVLHEDRLFIVGGLTGNSNHVLDDICYLDLKTWTWSRTWRFVGRFDHTAWIWGNRMWVFGGLGEDMERGGELFWLGSKRQPCIQHLEINANLETHGYGGDEVRLTELGILNHHHSCRQAQLVMRQIRVVSKRILPQLYQSVCQWLLAPFLH